MNLGGAFLTEEELRKYPFKSLGKNVKIHSRAIICGVENVIIGDNSRVDDYAIILATDEVSLGSYVHIPGFCFLGGKYGIRIDDFTSLAPGVKIFSSSDDYSGQFMTGPLVPSECSGGDKGQVVIGRHVVLGANTVVLPGLTVGEGSSVGAQSLVKKDLEPWGMYAGVPAKQIGQRKKDLLKLEERVKKEI